MNGAAIVGFICLACIPAAFLIVALSERARNWIHEPCAKPEDD